MVIVSYVRAISVLFMADVSRHDVSRHVKGVNHLQRLKTAQALEALKVCLASISFITYSEGSRF